MREMLCWLFARSGGDKDEFGDSSVAEGFEIGGGEEERSDLCFAMKSERKRMKALGGRGM